MGLSQNGEEKGYLCRDELPQHEVHLSSYEIGKYEVTRGQYRAFIRDHGYSTKSLWSEAGWKWKTENTITLPRFWNDRQNWASYILDKQKRSKLDFVQTDNHPVIGVSYYEAEAFCKWAGGRLPTEAEWEKASRWDAKESHPNVFPWGDKWDPEKCNNSMDHSLAGGGYLRRQTSAVGRYPSDVSPYGCRDMAGNADEWCSDGYAADYYSKAPEVGWTNPTGVSTSSERVTRGASWAGRYPQYYRCASRQYHSPTDRSYYVGFRLARDSKR